MSKPSSLNVLITGGSGLIGSQLSKQLTDRGHKVKQLVRKPSPISKYPQFQWDIQKKYIDKDAFTDINHIVHLAGESVAAGRWTDARKTAMTVSRVDAAYLILDKLKNCGGELGSFISASGVGYYGARTDEKLYHEGDAPGSDFLADLSVAWESAAQSLTPIAKRIVMMRTGMVLSGEGGALERLQLPVKMRIGAALGSGSQYVPWIHIDDIVGIYIHALENNDVEGAYNAVASEHVTNAELTQAIAGKLNRYIWSPNVPAFVLQGLMGEFSSLVLEGSKVDNSKIKRSGYQFKFEKVADALNDLL